MGDALGFKYEALIMFTKIFYTAPLPCRLCMSDILFLCIVSECFMYNPVFGWLKKDLMYCDGQVGRKKPALKSPWLSAEPILLRPGNLWT
jgi:hypothetical protein